MTEAVFAEKNWKPATRMNEEVQELLRCVLGGEQTRGGQVAIDTLAWIYEHWIPADKVIKTNTWSSELSKLVQEIQYIKLT